MQHTVEPFFILSAERVDRTPRENAANTGDLAVRLKCDQVPHKRVWGMLPGGAQPERSFLIVGNYSAMVRELAREYGQGSYLERHSDGFATEHLLSTCESRSRGKWVELSPREAREGDKGYTYDPETGLYWGLTQ